MSNACEESPAEDPSTISLQESSVNPSTISLQSSPGEEVLGSFLPNCSSLHLSTCGVRFYVNDFIDFAWNFVQYFGV